MKKILHVEFASVLKQLTRSPEGVPVLRLLVSGTKMDRTSYTHPETGVEVIGEKIVPELLASMLGQAKAGRVYLLENHGASIPMGWSADADLKDLGDGVNQELYVDFILDMDTSPAKDLVHILETRPDYEPACSVGLMVMREISYDDAEGGYVGRLTEGHFEHVAMTRPDHAAYPDADVEEVFLTNESFVEATKSLAVSTADAIIKFGTLDPKAASTKGASSMASVRVASGSPEKEESGVKIKRVAVTKEAEAEAKKESEAEASKEAEAEDCKDDSMKEADADAEAAKGEKKKGTKEHAENIAKLLKDAQEEGANPDDIKELLADISDDFAALCEAMEEQGMIEMEDSKDAEAEAESEAGKEDEKDAEAEDEDAAPPPPPAKKKPAPPAADADDDDEEEKEDEADEAMAKKKGDEMVAKSAKPKAKKVAAEIDPVKAMLDMVLKTVNERFEKIDEKLDHLDDLTPATRMPSRFNAKDSDADEASGFDRVEKAVRSLKEPRDREDITRAIAENLVTEHFGKGQK